MIQRENEKETMSRKGLKTSLWLSSSSGGRARMLPRDIVYTILVIFF